jgi:L-fucose isomerase-like protein
MPKTDDSGMHVGRRDFLKTTTLAGVAAALPATGLAAQGSGSPMKARQPGAKKKLLFLSDSTEAYQSLISALKTVQDIDFLPPVQFNAQKPQEISTLAHGGDADLLFICTPRVSSSSGPLTAMLGDMPIPVILFPVNLDLIMLEADVVGALREKGVNAMLANSEAHAVELVRTMALPGVLEGKRALIFGRPFDSSSVPTRNLTEDYVYRRTGVRIQYRPIEELKPLLEKVDEASARKEMERWKREAVKVVEPTDQAILEESRMYVLLRSIAEKEGLSAISIDCLSFSFNANAIIPLPCLAFSRLRDDGISAPCEADVCGTLASMFLQEISQKSSFFCNISSVDPQKGTAVLRHCVAPPRLMGRNGPPLPYNLRNYHGIKGVVPEVEFPVGVEVTMGVFTKDLRNFVLWPGRIQAGKATDTDRPSFPNMPSSKMRRYCSNRAEVKIRDVDRFIQNIGNCHHVMVAGTYLQAIRDDLLRMGINIIGPADMAVPEA